MIRNIHASRLFRVSLTEFLAKQQQQYSTAPPARAIIGIDLGTTNSCVALMDANKEIKVFENAEGSRTTPSIVAVDPKTGERYVGVLARRQAVTNPKNTFHSVKRLIGRKYNDPATANIQQHVPYKIVPGPNGDAWVEALGKQYSPSQIGAFVLTKMKETAELRLSHKVTEAVITVPAYFNDAQRQATCDAGRIAGLNVLRIINEPTAASLAYGLNQQDGQTIAVFDLGGGTFDVSILDINGGVFQVKATNGDTFLGGEDFDNVIVKFLVDEFKKAEGIDLSNNAIAMSRLKEAAEKAKKELDSQESVEVNLPYLYVSNESGPKHLATNLSKKHFEKLIEPLIQRSLDPCRQCLSDASMRISDINKVVLVGGMTRTPAVQNAVKAFFGKEPFKGVNPDEVVAVGAAVQGGVLAGSVKELVLVDVTPLSLGVNTHGDMFSRIIKRNTPVPISNTQTYTTTGDFQTDITFDILQGEREIASQNKALGTVRINIPPAPKGVPKIDVTFNIDASGIVHVTVVDQATRTRADATVRSSGGLSESEIQEMLRQAEMYAASDKKRKENTQAKHEVDDMIHVANKSMADNSTLTKNEELSKAEAEVKTALENLQRIISRDSENLANNQEFNAAKETLKAKLSVYTGSAYKARVGQQQQQQQPQQQK